MSADLTLPGTIPGLLRKCSPVNVDGRGGGVVVDKPGDKVDWFRVLCDGCEDEPDAESRSCVHLDLTDATGRDHALWWLAKTSDVYWMFCGLAHPGDRTFGWEFRSASGTPEHGGRRVFGSVDLPWQGTYVPALADLDPNDDRRLPDGSRWVDAEALRRVVLHVAGVPA